MPPAFNGPRAQDRGAPLAKHVAVPQLVERVFEIEAAEEGIRCDFGGAEDVAPAVGFDFAEDEQLAHPPVEVSPDPSVHRPEQAAGARATRGWHCARYGSTKKKAEGETRKAQGRRQEAEYACDSCHRRHATGTCTHG